VKRAFTLFEILLAISLLLAMSSTMFGFMMGMMDRRDRLLVASSDGRSGSALIERLENDILGAIAGDAGVGAGIKGSETGLTILTRAVNVPGDVSELRIALGDLQASRYVFKEEAGEVRIARWGVSPTGAAGSSSGSEEIVSDRVLRLRFRYHDGSTWLSSFDSLAQQGLPVAIEVAIWFGENQRAAIEAERPTQRTGEETPLQFGDDFPSDAAFALDDEFFDEDEPKVWGEPDRVRMIVVPDGPVAAWKEGQ
jgi:type II secretory pathway pseudopilin PulG